MKIKITYNEVQYFENIKEIEMDEKEYKQYIKTGKVSREIIDMMTSETDEKHHMVTEIQNIDLKHI